MDKKYEGLREDGRWEEFYAGTEREATPEATGYSKVRELPEEDY